MLTIVHLQKLLGSMKFPISEGWHAGESLGVDQWKDQDSTNSPSKNKYLWK
jgi:hypothetical protein